MTITCKVLDNVCKSLSYVDLTAIIYDTLYYTMSMDQAVPFILMMIDDDDDLGGRHSY